MSATAKLSSKFQIAIPKQVREAHRWEAGQKFEVISKGNGILLVPVRKLEELIGIADGLETENYRDREDRF